MSVIQKLRPDIDWNDSDRVNVLYAPFRSKSLNPESYEAKLKFWTETIEKWLEQENTFKFKICDLANDLQANSRKPLCLEDVVIDMKDIQKNIIESKDFVNGFQESWTWKILKAGTSYLVSTLSPKSKDQQKREINTTEFIHLGIFEKRAQNLLEIIKSSKKDFCKKSDILKADKDLDILLGYLQFKSGSIDICEIDEEVYIKDSKFNDTDIAVLKLKISIANLETTIEELEQKISKKRIEIKIAIKDSSRSKAKIILKQVKHLDLDLEKKMTSVENLRQVLESIQDVKDNKKVIETLKSAKKALHEETKDQDIDKIQDLVDDIKNLVETTEEISEALNPVSDSTEEDKSLEMELEKLIQETEEKEERELELALSNLTVKDEEKTIEKVDPDKAEPEKKLEPAMEAAM